MSTNPESKLQDPKSGKARYVMIGGFLGAGKTTAVARLAERLTKHGHRVGLITNDQGAELVDTVMLRSRGFATEEIPGGCFCCRFNSLVEAAQKLTDSTRPDVIIAEPVGSCTDLVATVTYPLRRIYGDSFSIAPLSVLVDPMRAARVFGLESGGKFSEKVTYIYRKQLEEADLIVINKCETLPKVKLEALRARLATEFPRAEILVASARTEVGLGDWFAHLESTPQMARETMPVDYALYGEGEALLGWLNATVALRGMDGDFDGNAAVRKLAEALQRELSAIPVEVAHLKMTLSTDEGLNDLAVINLVRSDFVPELSQELPDSIRSGQLILNLRAEGEPQALRKAVEETLGRLFAGKLAAKLEHIESFKPGQPRPTHRDVVGSS